jgi:hypothetical protein
MSLLYTRIARQRRRYDPDARLYLRLVENALGAATDRVQREAISDGIETEKDEGRWSSHRRWYMPIWGNASANAICLVSRTSGTFVGGVTHGAGFAQGNGSTGNFAFNASPAALGLSVGSSTAGVLVVSRNTVNATTGHLAVSSSFPNYYGLASPGNESIRYASMAYQQANGDIFIAGETSTQQTGILVGSKSGGVFRYMRRRTSGFEVRGSLSAAPNIGNAPTTTIRAMAVEVNGTVGGFSNAQYGAWASLRGLDDTQCEPFTLNLKNMWEKATGLTLP